MNELTGRKVFAVGTRISTHACELRLDLVNESFLLLALRNCQGTLQHVVGELVFHHRHDCADTVLLRGHNLVNQYAAIDWIGSD